MRTLRFPAIAGLLLLVACDAPPATGDGTTPPTEPAPTADRARDEVSTAPTGATGDGPKSAAERDGARDLAALEERLLSSDPLNFSYRARAEGALEISVEGEIRTMNDSEVTFSTRGEFGGREVSREVFVDSEMMSITGDATTPDTPETPREGRSHYEAVILGFTRMGVMHNVARMVAMQHPDHYDADPREWVQAINVRSGPPDEDHFDLVPLRFDIVVAGVESGSATLWLDPESGLPVEREQTVDFGEDGTMTVTETYFDWWFGEVG